MLTRTLYVFPLVLSLAACSGAPSTVLEPLAAPDAGAGDAGEVLDAGDAGTLVDVRIPPVDAGEVLDAGGDAGELAEAAAPPDAGGRDAGEVLDAGDAGPTCDPGYGDASPGGACCVHVWATPTMGAVLCTDGSRWCWQSGSPCSPPGGRCVTQSGVTYCAP